MPDPVSINQYRSFADQSLGQIVLGKNAEGQSILQGAGSSKLNALKRFFNTSASQQMNRAVMEDFKRALKKTYGNLVAESTFSTLIGSDYEKGAKLTSKTIKNALAFAQAESVRVKQAEVEKLQKAYGSLQLNFSKKISFTLNSANADGVKQQVVFDKAVSENLESQVAAFRKAQEFTIRFNDLLSVTPVTLEESMEVQRDISALKNEMCQFLSYAEQISDKYNALLSEYANSNGVTLEEKQNGSFAERMIGDLRKKTELLESRLVETEQMMKNNPLNYASVIQSSKLHIEAFDKVLGNVNERLSQKGRKTSASTLEKNFMQAYGIIKDNGLMKLLGDRSEGKKCSVEQDISFVVNRKRCTLSKETLNQWLSEIIPPISEEVTGGDGWQNAICPDAEKRLGGDYIKRLLKFVCKITNHISTQAGNTSKKLEKESLGKTILPKEFNKVYVGVLDSQGWDPIKKEMSFVYNQESHKITSEIIPASNLAGPVGDSYKEIKNENGEVIHPGRKGVCSRHFDESVHAVNLAHTKVSLTIPGEAEPRQVFSGIRHSVHAAMELKGQAFIDANRSRAKEMILAAFTSSPELMKKLKAGVTTEFLMSSTSLLTPDAFRKAMGPTADERAMLKAQVEALNFFDGQEIELPINGEVYKIKPEIIPFNYGNNDWAVGWKSGLGGWGNVDSLNSSGIRRLQGKVNEALEKYRLENKADSPEAKAIATLMRQINEMVATESYKRSDGDNCKMGARISVLTYLLGGVPCWNCKSGKDRTGMVDVECKALATIIALGHPIPEPGKNSSDYARLIKDMSYKSGNIELQKYSGGFGGFRLHGFKHAVQKRIQGSKAELNTFLGLSGLNKF